MKKLFILQILIAIGLALSACSSNTDLVSMPTTGKPTTAVPTTGSFVTNPDTITSSTTMACNHLYINATCTAPKMCSFCGITDGDALGHNWRDATCSIPRICTACGMTDGKIVEHCWREATCIEPKLCTICGKTDGESLGHSPILDAAKEATCKKPGKTEGSHCSRCNMILKAQKEVVIIPHKYDGNSCRMCGSLREGMEYLLEVVAPYSTPYWYKSNITINMAGQTYLHGFTCMGYGTGYGDTKSGNITCFNLSEKYEKLTFTAGIVNSSVRKKPVEFIIYADGRIIYSFEMSSDGLPQEHSVSISGCNQLMIAVYDGYGVANGSGTYGIAEIVVEK